MAGEDSRKSLGAKGEDLAAQYLQAAGYQILARNFRRRYGEIDIIVAKAGVTYFVEVKTKTSSAYTPPQSSVGPAKRGQISRMAALWFAEQGRETESSLLVAEVRLDAGRVDLIEDFLC